MNPFRPFAVKSYFPVAKSMSNYTVASLKRVSAKTLSEKILEEQEKAEPSFAVIDVRDVGTLYAHDFLTFFLCLRDYMWL
jgi:hypothetical protein